MSFTTHSGKRNQRRRPVSDINMIPFIDICLVLLIVFMITTPLMVTGIPINMPKSKQSALQMNEKPTVLTIDAQGNAYIENKQVNDIDSWLVTQNPQKTLYIRSDEKAPYGAVMHILDTAKSKGITKFSLLQQRNKT
jgi:biopolymer transport protein TolR